MTRSKWFSRSTAEEPQNLVKENTEYFLPVQDLVWHFGILGSFERDCHPPPVRRTTRTAKAVQLSSSYMYIPLPAPNRYNKSIQLNQGKIRAAKDDRETRDVNVGTKKQGLRVTFTFFVGIFVMFS